MIYTKEERVHNKRNSPHFWYVKYKSYKSNLSKNKDFYFYTKESKEFGHVNELIYEWFLYVSKRFINFVEKN